MCYICQVSLLLELLTALHSASKIPSDCRQHFSFATQIFLLWKPYRLRFVKVHLGYNSTDSRTIESGQSDTNPFVIEMF